MKKSNRLYSMACAALLSAVMTVQTLCPAFSMVMADTTETEEPEITIETTVSSEDQEETVVVEVDETDDTDSDDEYVDETEDLTATEAEETDPEEEETISSATDTDPTEIDETEETEELIEDEELEEIEYVVFDHYYSDIDDNLVNTSDLFVITSDASVFTRATNVVSNYDDAYIIECNSVEEARFVYSYYVDKVEFITDLSDVVSIATDDEVEDSSETVEEIEITEETEVEVSEVPEQEPDVADLSDLNSGNDAIANLNDIDTVNFDFNGYVALIDTGANANITYSVTGNDYIDPNGHGSQMLGFIREENPNARVISIKVSDDGSASAADVYAGFRVAIDLGVSVINFSMTAPDIQKNAVIRDIIQEALDAGITVIGAAGNNAISATHFIPGCIDGVITVGAVDVNGTKIHSSNYNADLYVVANSTSEATARYTGLYTAGIADVSDKVFDQVIEDDDYIPEDYSWAYEVAEELTNRLLEEYGYGYVAVEFDEDGNVWFRYVMDGELDGNFNAAAWPVSDATINVGEVNYQVANGTYTGTCSFTATNGGKGTASGFTGTLGAWMSAAGLSSITMICSKNFGSEASNHALSLPTGTCNYTATYSDGTWTIIIGQRPGATQPEWTRVNDSVSYTVANTDGANLAVTVGNTTRYVPLTQAATGVVTEVTDLVRSMTVIGEYNGNKNCSVSVPSTGVGTHSASRSYDHTDDTQAYEAVMTSTTSPRFAAVEFSKVGPDQEPLSGAIIYFVCTGGEGVGHTDELRTTTPNLNLTPCTYNGYAGVQFTTNGQIVNIENLRPNSTYVFHEYQAPLLPDGSGRRYALAEDRTVTVDANGICNPGSITMTDRDNPRNPNFSSIAILKIWEPSDGRYYDQDGSFWSDAGFVSFAMQFRGDWTTVDSYGWGDSFLYGRLYQVGSGNPNAHNIDPQTGLAYWPVGWDCSRGAAVAYGGIHLYDGDNGNIEGRYFQHQNEGGQFVDNEGTWTTDVTYLPYGYYHVTESWDEAYMSLEGQKIFIESANDSGWFLESGGPGTGSCTYGIIIKIDGDGTHICNRDGSIVGDLPLEGGVRVARAHNESRTGRVDVVKVDETGTIHNGEAVVSFELHSAEGNNPLIATGTLNTRSASSEDGGNTFEYQVDWAYSYYQSHRGNDSQWFYSLVEMKNEPYVGHLNYGNYYIYEYIRDAEGNNIAGQYRIPEGWSAWDSDNHREWHIGDAGEPEYFYRLVSVTSANHTTPLQVQITNRQYRFEIEAWKVDESTGSVLSSYTGTIEFELYIDLNNNGIIDADDRYLGTATDNDDGTKNGKVHFAYLYEDLGYTDLTSFPTRFLIRETQAPEGFYLNDEPVLATVTAAGSFRAIVEVNDTPFIELSFGIDKYDEWTDELLSSYEGDYDATFELWVDVNGDGVITEGTDRLLDVLTDTDRNGHCDVEYVLTPEVIREKFPECINADGSITGNSARNYPTEYLVRETVAPFDFYLNETLYRISLSGRQFEETATRTGIDDTPYTARISMYKIDGDTGDHLSNAIFTIYNDVNGNGIYDEGIDTRAKTYSESTDSLVDAQIVWNAQRNCYYSSPLRSGRYVVVETGLPDGYFYVDANGVPTLERNEVPFEIVAQDVSHIGTSSARDDVYEGTVYNLKPSIHTMLHDPLTLSQVAHVAEDCELVDIVSYNNLVPNQSYVMSAVIMVRETNEPLTDAEGNIVTGETIFTPTEANGTIEVSIHLDTERVMRLVEEGVINAPVDLVCFEQCRFNTDDDMTTYHQWYDEGPVVTHEDINDEGQTVRVGEIHTGVYDNQSLSQVASMGPNGDGYAVIVDHVHYEGLQPGTTYTMIGEMHLLTYDENGNAVDGGVINGADGRENLHPTTTFVPEEHEGYVDVVYTIDVSRFRGQTMVSFETCEQNGVTIMWHCDIEDLPQTLFVPDVHTNAYCPDTTPGEMGRTVLSYGERARVVDEVRYENLLVDGRQYMVQGSLYWMYQDENGAVHSGPMSEIIGEAQAMSTIFFTPCEQNGTVEMTFTFDSRVLQDLHYDKLVVCETIYANGGIGWTPIAHHWDFSWENNAQSIEVPQIHTTASTEIGTTLPETVDAVITDRVYYENLVVGTEYTVVGNVQFARTDANGNIFESGALMHNGEPVTAQTTFVPTTSSGYVDVVFTVNALEVQFAGYDKLVVFESLYVGPGVLVSVHADINDQDQTIDVPETPTPTPTPPETPPKTGDESGYATYVAGAIIAITFLAAGIALLAVLDRKNNPKKKK